MGKYIALVGDEYRTAVNSLWAVLKEERFEPEELYIVLEEEKEESGLLKNDLEKVLENYDMGCSVESNLLSDIQDVRQMIDGSEDFENGEVALDISAASKLTTAEVLMDKGCDLFDHIFYLKINDEDKFLPLPTIESTNVRLKDLRSKDQVI